MIKGIVSLAGIFAFLLLIGVAGWALVGLVTLLVSGWKALQKARKK